MRWLPLLLAVFAIAAGLPAGLCFVLGAALALVPHPGAAETAQRWSKPLLQLSVVLLGAASSLGTVRALGLPAVAMAAAGIVLTLGLAWLLGRRFGLPAEVQLLIAFGTAICGASAIAAVGSARRSPPAAIATALGVVLSLNALALYVYPWLGHALDLSPRAFGLWSALAIHDTSSVVGAALRYSDDAVGPATTLKLVRALFIIPVTALVGAQRGTRARPWFILGFFAVVGLATWLGEGHPLCRALSFGGRRMLAGVLLLVGWSLPLSQLRRVGWRPFAFGALLAVGVGLFSLGMILGW